MRPLVWIDDSTCRVDDTYFVCAYPATKGSTPDRFVVLKPRNVIERYVALLETLQPRRIVEVGVFDGGSAALFSLLCEPDLLAAIDIEPDPAPALEPFLERRGLTDAVKCHFGVDQSDVAALDRVVASSVGEAPLDLVIDDASHVTGPTRATFDRLFPLLRPGGVYVIEDWSAAHRYEKMITSRMASDEVFAERFERHLTDISMVPPAPLTLLVFELVMVAGYQPEVVCELTIDPGRVLVTRGPAELDPSAFSVAATYGANGARVVEAMGSVWAP